MSIGPNVLHEYGFCIIAPQKYGADIWNPFGSQAPVNTMTADVLSMQGDRFSCNFTDLVLLYYSNYSAKRVNRYWQKRKPCNLFAEIEKIKDKWIDKLKRWQSYSFNFCGLSSICDIMIHIQQGKSEGFDICNRPSNLTQTRLKPLIFQPM